MNLEENKNTLSRSLENSDQSTSTPESKESIEALTESFQQEVADDTSNLKQENEKLNSIEGSILLADPQATNEIKKELQLEEKLQEIDSQAEELKQVTQDAIVHLDKVNNQLEQTPLIKEGVDFVFKVNPKLLEIGTPKQYSEYLDTIFPESKLKNKNQSVIMYHNTRQKFNLEDFDSNRTMYFTSSQNGYFQSNENTVLAIVNIQNPAYVDAYEITNKAERVNAQAYIDQKCDGLIATNEVYVERVKESNQDPAQYKQDLLFPEVVIFEPKQIHILGSNNDADAFKKFVIKK